MNDSKKQEAEPRTVGRYQLLRSLGRGGFGEVFLGEAEDGTRAAVKLLHSSWAGDRDMRRRFAAEVDQARKVSGFCIAGILDAAPEAAEPWIATEYIDGPTLRSSIETDGPRTGVELQRLTVGTATALAAIHAAGVVHRDLKPENIMLAPDGPRVIDFGIARAVESTSVTASGIVGTVGYMAPEQLEGMRLSPAVDVFAWASVAVFAAIGREAFHGPTQAARIARVLSGEPDTGDLSGPLLDIVLACLDKNPKRRPDAPTLLHHLIANTPPAPVAPTRGEERTQTPPIGASPVNPTRAYTRTLPEETPSTVFAGGPTLHSSAPVTPSYDEQGTPGTNAPALHSRGISAPKPKKPIATPPPPSASALTSNEPEIRKVKNGGGNMVSRHEIEPKIRESCLNYASYAYAQRKNMSPDGRIEAIKKLAGYGIFSAAHIAKILDVHRSLLTRHGIKVNTGQKRMGGAFNPEYLTDLAQVIHEKNTNGTYNAQKISRAYNGGCSITVIARLIGISTSYTSKLLSESR